jgi:pimeloyl-ACP methyl ester carboxylesterase
MRIAPERVTRLALLDTSARPDTPEQTKRRQQLLEMSSAGEFPRVTDLLLPTLLHQARMSDEVLTRRIKAMAEHVGSDAFARQQNAIMHRPDNRPNLGSIAVPTLVLCGRQDALTPPGIHEEMAGLIPNSRYALIEECGHMTTMERPFAATALLREWLVND